ncbi:glycoside hydrolase family 70 protein [Convivina intestini]|uniref:glycoside hydrolase family 70 protein n=1 Tax=Convivina intestini TaxID=1505726 RepID=UPI00200D506A|nr:glycoside hydrolase family 70 protein [Convivina intestini]CAH1856516.1 hypothetical protein R078131_01418 [Convivina intestini]
MNQRETKNHFKMYKKGKMWVYASLTTFSLLSLFGINTTTVSADGNSATNTAVVTKNQDKNLNNTQKNNNSNPFNNNDDNDTLTITNQGTTSTVKADSNPQPKVTNNGQDVVAQNSVTVTTKTDYIPTNEVNYIGDIDGKFIPDKTGNIQFILTSTGKPIYGLNKIDGFTQYFDDQTGYQLKGVWKTQNNDTYYFAPGTGNAVTGIQKINDLLYGFDDDGIQVKNDFLSNRDGLTYYFNGEGHVTSGLQTVNNKQYFTDNNGVVVKGGTSPKMINGVEYYFDSVDGHATISNVKQYVNGLESQDTDFNSHNQIVNVNATLVDNVDGFMTANSWYQPKDILQNGEEWVPATTTDRRPVLMAWWPTKNTETDYVNFMMDKKIISGNKVDINNVSQATLNEYAKQIQVSIEKRITSSNSTVWLHDLMQQFQSTQAGWNISSESPNPKDGFQGGTLAFQNSAMTPWANSNFRYLNRTPTNQEGKQPQNEMGGYEFLLANDIDNSNPTVQAEQLNWLHYLLHFGSITAQDSNANFDGYRVDAVDNVDADLLQIAAEYMKQVYKVDENDNTANKHLSILEDWDYNDFDYTGKMGSNQLTMDFKAQTQLIFSLTQIAKKRDSMDRFLQWFNVDRRQDNTENTAIPNYSFLRAHDSQVQTIISQIIKDYYPGADGYRPTKEQLLGAFKVYNVDQQSTDKRYTLYNVPAAYAMLLTNKDTVPRVYYGDLFTDDGQYMAQKSPYYAAIDNLLKDRIKYVAGGQATSTGTWLPFQNTSSNRNDILTTVRYGKGLMNASDLDQSGNHQRTDGMGLIVSNNPDFQLGDSEQVVLHMGASHANQKFRASLLSTQNGLEVYSTDDGAPTIWTDAQGDLKFDKKWVYGVSNPQVSGYLAVWVPTGASSTQDARSLNDDTMSHSSDGKTLHSNAVLDSNLIYEGFSNFQSDPTNESEYTNVKIAQNVDLFKSWGVTSFQFAPQYRSSTDSSFIDSIIKNGYSFTDRYDLGFNDAQGNPNPTKYGTDQQLRDALKAVHAANIQAIADWVPDQLYNLPLQEVVTATRTDTTGVTIPGTNFKRLLYVANTKSDDKDYQFKYGGAFLKELKNKYPALFTTKQISTGVPIDADNRIQQWAAKYLNGTNILGHGAHYILSDFSQNKPFRVTGETFLPKQLLNENILSGFNDTPNGTQYYSFSGYQAKNSFIQDDSGNTYYFDNNGYMVGGNQHIDGQYYHFLSNGILLRNNLWRDINNNEYYSGDDGSALQGFQIINGQAYDFGTDNTYNLKTRPTGYFYDGTDWHWYENGVLYSGIKSYEGAYYYFVNGMRQDNAWESTEEHLYYFGNDGRAFQGLKDVANNSYYFGNDDTFYLRTNQLISDNGQQYMAGDNGVLRPWSGYIRDGASANGGYHWYEDGQLFTGFRYYEGAYYWFLDGTRQNNQWENAWGQKYYVGSDGRAVQGLQVIDGQAYDFGEDGTYNLKTQPTGYFSDGNGWRWFENGQLYTGIKWYEGSYYYFEKGERQNNAWATAWGYQYYFGADGRAVQGNQLIDNHVYNFGDDNTYYARPVAGYVYDGSSENGGYRWYENGQLFTGFRYYAGAYYWFLDGVRQNNQWESAWGMKYYVGTDGRAVQGNQTIEGQNYYFGNDGTYFAR